MRQQVVVTQNPDRLKGEISFEERDQQLKENEDIEELKQKKTKNSPYDEFAQVNISTKLAKDIMLKLSDTPPAAKIFWFITQNMDGYNALIASYTVFQEALQMSRATVARGIKTLKDMGLLHVAKSGSSNVYLISPQLVWKSWGSNLKYCEFPARVVLAQSEQYPDAKEVFSKQMHRVLNVKDNGNDKK